MSESQYSDALSSSIYGDDIDKYLENPHSFTPNPSGSQQTFGSLEPEFLRPSPRPTVPSSLTRLGPNRRKDYVLYDEMLHEDFVSWWLATDCGRKGNIHWDSKHQSDA
jgi:hypothetical protein